MAISKRNNITIVCEGDTEYNYLTGLKKEVKSTLNIIPCNADGGDYPNVLKKLKETSATGTVARFVLVDFDRFINVLNEDKNFYKLLEYCKNEQTKGNPTFLVVSNPDFDRFVLKHNVKYKNQDKYTFLKENYNYKSVAEFKKDVDVFKKFNKNEGKYLEVASKMNSNEYLVSNLFVFNSKKFTFQNMSIVFEKNNDIYKVSNILDLFKIL